MKKSIFSLYVIPFLQWYAVMILMAIIIDYFLHRWHFENVGLFCGYAGTTLIVFSFGYSLRKRKIIKKGSPKQLLHVHEYMAWSGSVLILVHAGIHFNAVLPWLAIFMMLIAVASGLTGKFLLKNAAETLKQKKQELMNGGMTKEQAEHKLFFDGITVDMMKKWRVVHLPITLLLLILVLMHIITIVMFS